MSENNEGRRFEAHLMRLLDESHMANSIVYRAMHGRGLFVLDGVGCRRPDGTIDPTVFHPTIDRLFAQVPEFSLGARRAPLGLSAPFWVPVRRPSAAERIRVAEGRYDLRDPSDLAVMIGQGARPLDLRRSPWDMVLHDLVDGRVCLTVRIQHVLGDGRWLVKNFRNLITDAPVLELDPASQGAPLGRAPWGGVHAAVIAARTWYREQGSWRQARATYARMPVSRRARRVLGRWKRFLLEPVIALRREHRRRIPPLECRTAHVAMKEAKTTARQLDCSVGILAVAACLTASLAVSDRRQVTLLMPVWHRIDDGRAARNSISVRPVTAEAGSTLRDVVESVKAQAAASDPPRGRPDLGYATFVPFDSRMPVYLGPCRVEQTQVWPTGHPLADLACLMSTSGDRLTIQLLTQAGGHPDELIAALETTMAQGDAT